MTQSNHDNKIKVDVLDYLGKHEDGILTLLSLGYKDEYYEATFFYTKDLLALTPDEKLEQELGSIIEEWEGYNQLMFDILNKVVPYNEMINIVNDFEPDKWGLFLDKN
jgi:hypothetical protein